MLIAMEVTTRNEAHSQGKKFYFTGHPCKNGHLAARYVSTGGCTDCLLRYKPRINSFSHDLVPYSDVFWRSKRLSEEQLKQLKTYVQQCIDHFTDQLLPKVCPTCTGRQIVPYKGPMRVEWKACPTCMPGIIAPGSEAPPLR